ncbi:MAG: hypothetical protein HY319_10225 [Armatimonadetes bacterium]|nr:hypothetical protein [Armatimonadota bacterium]
MLSNLEQDAFTGYVSLKMEGGDGFVFFSRGTVVRAVETQNSEFKVRMLPRILNKVKQVSEVATSSYVLSSNIVEVLSALFAFKPLYIDYQVKRKELKKVLTNLEHDEMSGVLEVREAEQSLVYLLLERGNLVTDRFTSSYGDIVCGTEEVSSLLDHIHKNGAMIQVYAEKAHEIENKKRMIEEDLEKIRQLIVKSESGMFRDKETIKVAEEIVREWGLDVKSTFRVEVETGSGDLYSYKCQGARKLGGYASLHTMMLNSMGVKDGDLVNVRPL